MFIRVQKDKFSLPTGKVKRTLGSFYHSLLFTTFQASCWDRICKTCSELSGQDVFSWLVACRAIFNLDRHWLEETGVCLKEKKYSKLPLCHTLIEGAKNPDALNLITNFLDKNQECSSILMS